MALVLGKLAGQGDDGDVLLNGEFWRSSRTREITKKFFALFILSTLTASQMKPAFDPLAHCVRSSSELLSDGLTCKASSGFQNDVGSPDQPLLTTVAPCDRFELFRLWGREDNSRFLTYLESQDFRITIALTIDPAPKSH